MNKPLIDEFGEVRELSAEDLAQFKPAAQMLPAEFMAMAMAHQNAMTAQGKMRTRGKQKLPTKRATTLRLDNEVLDYFKAGGKGWQTRLNAALREYIATH